MGFIESVVIQLVIGLILLLVGQQLGYRQAKRQFQESEAGDIQNLKDSLLNEVNYNLDLLNKGYHENKYGRKMFLHRLFRDAFDHAKANDAFRLLSAETQISVSSYYGGVDRMNVLVNRFDGEEVALTLNALYNQQTELEAKLRKATEDLKKLLARAHTRIWFIENL